MADYNYMPNRADNQIYSDTGIQSW